MKAWTLTLLLPALLLGSTPVINRPVVDPRGLLSPADTEAVADELVRLRRETDAQMAVLLVGTTGGEPIEDYAMRAAESWKGGRGGQDDGLLFVLAVDDRRMRLDVGYGLEEYLPDDAVRRILDAQGPLLRQRDYRGAVLGVIQGVRAHLPGGEGTWSPTPLPGQRFSVRNTLLGVLLAGIIAGALLAGCTGPWREPLGPWGLAGSVGALLLIPSVLIVLGLHRFQVPSLHFLMAYVAFAAMFFLVTLAILHLSFRIAAVLGLSASLGSGVAIYSNHSTDVVEMVRQAGAFSSVLAISLVVITYPPVFNFLFQVLVFLNSFNSGSSYRSGRSSYRSSSGSSWGSSSSSSGSSSGSSWGGGGGSFGGGGASSSW